MAVMMRFLKAERNDSKPLLGLVGPPGVGKTMSALRIAKGIKEAEEAAGNEPGPICLVDTENGRAGVYAPRPGDEPDAERGTFDFQTLVLHQPFTPLRFAEAVEAAQIVGPSCIIIDSASPEWTGVGGVLEMVDGYQGKNKYGAWKLPRAQYARFIARLKEAQCPCIVTMRAKDKTAMQGSEIISLGWQPVADTELPYDMDINFLLLPEARGHLNLARFDSGKLPLPLMKDGVFKDGELATEEVGRRLADWAAGRDVTNGG